MGRKKSRQDIPAITPQVIPAARRPLGRTMLIGVLIALGIGTVLTLSLVPGSSGGTTTAAEKPAHGETLFRQYCVACHGVKGIGEFSWQTRERAAPPLDSSGHAWHHEDAQLVRMILDKPLPDSKMPAWGSILSRNDALDLVAYIKTLWTPYIRDNCQGARHMECMGMR